MYILIASLHTFQCCRTTSLALLLYFRWYAIMIYIYPLLCYHKSRWPRSVILIYIYIYLSISICLSHSLSGPSVCPSSTYLRCWLEKQKAGKWQKPDTSRLNLQISEENVHYIDVSVGLDVWIWAVARRLDTILRASWLTLSEVSAGYVSISLWVIQNNHTLSKRMKRFAFDFCHNNDCDFIHQLLIHFAR